MPRRHGSASLRTSFAAPWKVLGSALAAFLCLAAYCLYTGFIQFNAPSPERYPVRGVDVSHHQGDIDWSAIARQDIRFAFIKATEGGDFRDPRFGENWKGAHEAGLIAGAYHFSRCETSGELQAANFIATAPLAEASLPPVVDLECPRARFAPARDRVRKELRLMLAHLEASYGVKPILYATGEAYDAFLNPGFDEFPLWIRSVFTHPSVWGYRPWTFWQYSNRGRLEGSNGRDPRIDLNVFEGSEEAFRRFAGLAP